MNSILPSELLIKRKFRINNNHDFNMYQNVYDVMSDFQGINKIVDTTKKPIQLVDVPEKKPITNSSTVTSNKNAQIIKSKKAQKPFTVLPVAENKDFSVIDPSTIVSIPQSPIHTTRMEVPLYVNNWTGQWISKDIFNGNIKFSFHINKPKAYVGIIASGTNNETYMFKTNYQAGFFFKSATVFGVIDTTIKHTEAKSNIFRIDNPWSCVDTFAIVYSAKLVQYFQNDKHIYTVDKRGKTCDTEDTTQKKQSIYIAGAFYTAQAEPITVSQITIDEILPPK
jgi:hypothetical protein